MSTPVDASALREVLERAVSTVGAPGAAAGVRTSAGQVVVTAGIADARTNDPITEQTLFLSGSIQKVHTATLAMLLVDEGSLSLDAPVRDVIDGFRVADPQATARITLRQTLAHTCGVDADQFFPDAGDGDDAVARYIDALADVEQLHPPGALTSYCNGGTVIAGRLTEVATRRTYDDVLRERLLEPAGLSSTTTALESVGPRAAGHVGRPGAWTVIGAPTLGRGAGPAGGTMWLTMSDLLAFGALHAGTDDALPRNVVDAMREPQPSADERCDVRGIGWELFDGGRILSHDGFNGGQTASVRVVPEAGVVAAVCIGHARGPLIAGPVLTHVFDELGIALPALPAETAADVDPDPVVGRYERRGVRFEITVADGGLVATLDEDGRSRPHVAPLRPTTDGFLLELPVFGDVVARFLTDASGVARYFYAQGRAARRVQ